MKKGDVLKIKLAEDKEFVTILYEVLRNEEGVVKVLKTVHGLVEMESIKGIEVANITWETSEN